MNLLRATIADLSRALSGREVSSLELTRAYLDRIGRYNGRLNAYLRVFEDQALREAKLADEERAAGRTRGPLHGIPLAIKDIIDIEGTVTTAGGVLLPDTPARADAEVIRRLKAAGAVILGKLNLHEYAWGGTTQNPHYGNCINPWKDGYTPGGSSGGSASAVVAGLAAGALGTDTLGSVRIPSSYCGCVGLKTTYGLVSVRGVYPLSWSLDTVGPIARSTEDAALLLAAISGPDADEPTSAGRDLEAAPWDATPSLEGFRIGVVRNYSLAHDGTPEEVEVCTIVAKAIDQLVTLGARRVDIDLPELGEARALVMKIAFAEASAVHEKHLKEHPEKIGEDVRQRLELGRTFTGVDLARAYRRMAEIRHRALAAMNEAHVLVFPGTATASHAFNPLLALKTPKYTGPINLLGWPALSLPCGFNAEGLPVGLQIAAPPFGDLRALRVARAYEASTPWSDRKPSEFEA